MNQNTAFLSLALLFGAMTAIPAGVADAAQESEMLRVYMNNARVLRLDRRLRKSSSAMPASPMQRLPTIAPWC